MKKVILALSVSSLTCITGCTEPGETTGIAAATGGVMGAGLGAIIGSQTGSAGAGLAIGAAAGAAGGAAIGNALEAQQQAVRTQDEALERQEKMIAAQKAEIDELRSLGQDNAHRSGVGTGADVRAASRQYSYERSQSSPSRSAGRDYSGSWRTSNPIPRAGGAVREATTEVAGGSGIKSRTIVSDTNEGADTNEGVVEPSAVERAVDGESVRQPQRARLNPVFLESSECQKAADEARTGDAAAELSERLFHYRRALRMCHDNPDFHNRLGEVYLSLNRSSDARFEFREALKLDPTHEEARANLKQIE